jgi:hypothetical protein
VVEVWRINAVQARSSCWSRSATRGDVEQLGCSLASEIVS